MFQRLKEINKARKTLRNKRGMTLFQLIVIIIVIIVLGVVFSDMNLIRKINRGKDSAAWSTELSTLTNSVLSARDVDAMMYSTMIQSSDGVYRLVVPAPTVSAYEPIGKYIIEGTATAPVVSLNYNSNSTVSLQSSNPQLVSGTSVLTTFAGKANTGQPAQLPDITSSGSNGIAPFINVSIPSIEESVFQGLLNAKDTQIGKFYSEEGVLPFKAKANASPSSPLTGTAKATTDDMKELMKLVFGVGVTRDYNTSNIDAVIKMRTMNADAVKEFVGGSYRFYDADKYRMYWVHSILTENEFVEFMKPRISLTSNGIAAGIDNVDEMLREWYDGFSSSITVDNIVIMPIIKSSSVYSESSDFKLYKFTTTD